MRNHAVENNIWNDGQLGAAEWILGTVDQLIIDRCIMEEVKTQPSNLAVAFCQLQKSFVVQRCSVEMVFLEKFRKIHMKTPAPETLF